MGFDITNFCGEWLEYLVHYGRAGNIRGDIVANLISMPFSRWTLNEKLELIWKGSPTPEANLVQSFWEAFKTQHLHTFSSNSTNNGKLFQIYQAAVPTDCILAVGATDLFRKQSFCVISGQSVNWPTRRSFCIFAVIMHNKNNCMLHICQSNNIISK